MSSMPRPPCAPCFIKSGLIRILHQSHFISMHGETNASSGFGLWAKTPWGQQYFKRYHAVRFTFIGCSIHCRCTCSNGLLEKIASLGDVYIILALFVRATCTCTLGKLQEFHPEPRRFRKNGCADILRTDAQGSGSHHTIDIHRFQ